MEIGKTCFKCDIWKPLDGFEKQATGAMGRRSQCRACRNARKKVVVPPSKTAAGRRAEMLRLKYGISVFEWNSLLDWQGGRCAIPSCTKTEPGGRGTWLTDHDHDTGEVRGLLCYWHNTALGKFGDGIDGVLEVVDYLTNPPFKQFREEQNVRPEE